MAIMQSTCGAIRNAVDKCAYATVHCNLNSVLQYGQWYYCTQSDFVMPFKGAALLAFLLYLFAVVGIAAFDFLCPNLRIISSRSGLSQSVLGVTILAFGNGSVDVFGAIAAMGSGNASLAIGEITGAVLFIVALVVGTIIFCQNGEPIELNPIYFKRDALFLLGATILVGLCLYDGKITVLESLLMLTTYALYSVTVVVQHVRDTYYQSESVSAEDGSSSRAHSPFEAEGQMTPMRTSLFSAFENSHTLSPQVSDSPFLNIPEPQPPTPAFRMEIDSCPEPDQSRSLRHNQTSHEEIQDRLVPNDLPKLITTSPFDDINSSNHTILPNSLLSHSSEHSNLLTPSPGIAMSGSNPYCPSPVSVVSKSSLLQDHGIKEHLFPITASWNDQSFLGRVVAILMIVPIFFFKATIPIPVIQPSVEILVTYAVSVPISAAYLLHAPFNIYTALSVVSCTGVFLWIALSRKPLDAVVISILGFLMAIFWIVNLASELVALLQILGIVCHVSDAVLGLTVFAMGDSLGDLISNVTIARHGYPTMALSACFGSPVFTLLVGIGGASLITMANERRSVIEFDISPSILLSCVMIIVSVLILLGGFIVQKHKLSWPLGLVTFTLWAINILVSVVVNS